MTMATDAPYCFDLVTLFPGFFDSIFATGLLGTAIRSGQIGVRFHDPRDDTADRHRTVDDTPYGGGAGMVMKADVMARAIARARQAAGASPVVLLTPQGAPLSHARIRTWAEGSGLVLVSGRYEGFDERIRAYVDAEVSLGDFVLTGGEYAAAAIVDAVSRLRPGTLGNAASSAEDSHATGRLEHPHYTRPLSFDGRSVPEVLRSGHHAKVAVWRERMSLERTFVRRPELIRDAAGRRWVRTEVAPRLTIYWDPPENMGAEAKAACAATAEAFGARLRAAAEAPADFDDPWGPPAADVGDALGGQPIRGRLLEAEEVSVRWSPPADDPVPAPAALSLWLLGLLGPAVPGVFP